LPKVDDRDLDDALGIADRLGPAELVDQPGAQAHVDDDTPVAA
jgi:hypothetical protein